MSRALPISFYLLVCLGLLIGNIKIYQELFAPRILEVSALDVGKGDAVLVRTPNQQILLIDTGPDASILRALGATLPPWQRTIDAIIITSTKKSSVGGLNDVLSRYKVSQQLTISESRRLTFGDGSYIDIVLSPNATTTVSVKNAR